MYLKTNLIIGCHYQIDDIQMVEYKYDILDDFGNPIAENMNLQMVMAFIQGYVDVYYNEPLNLTIKQRVPKNENTEK